MIRIEEEKLTIEIDHRCSEEFHADLKEAIITIMQHQNATINDPKVLYGALSTSNIQKRLC